VCTVRDHADPLTVDGNAVTIGVDAFTYPRDPIVHGHAPGLDQLLGVPPRCHAGTGQRALEPHRLGHRWI
jgi:hypothetical protein